MVLALIMSGAKLVFGGLFLFAVLGTLGVRGLAGAHNYPARTVMYVAFGMLVYDATISRGREMRPYEGALVAGPIVGYSLYKGGII